MVDRSRQQYDAYCAFIERHRETVWRTCYRFAKGNRAACEDMVQEVWIALWLRFDQLKTDLPELMQRAWLKRVTQSVLVDLYRRAESEPERLTPALVNTLPDTHVDYAESIDDLMSTLSDDEERSCACASKATTRRRLPTSSRWSATPSMCASTE
jgi:RNA polymerase sigma factor (sigma-70 family)